MLLAILPPRGSHPYEFERIGVHASGSEGGSSAQLLMIEVNGAVTAPIPAIV